MKKISFSLLIARELYTMGLRVHNLVSDSVQEDTFIASMLLKLKNSLDTLSNILGRVTSSKYTRELFLKDGQRDSAFLGFRDFIKAHIHHVEPDISMSAQVLYAILERNGLTLYNLGYASETAQMNVLIADMESDEAQSHLQTINGTEWYTNLVNKQRDFEHTYQQKVDEEADENLPRLRAGKSEAVKYITGLLSYIKMKNDLDPDQFQSLVDSIDEVITDTMIVARSRKSRNENGGFEEDNQSVA